jgi:hypothetical protein
VGDALRALARRRRAGVAVGAVAATALAIGLLVAAGLPGSSPAAGSLGKVAGATTVQRRDLVATDTESGTLTYASPQTVFNRLPGTITWLPTVGQPVKPGQTLYQVDGQPVVLFNGATPAYRDLTSGVSDGPDVLELNRDLVGMGFDPGHEITVNSSWQAGTTDAIDRWQASLGASQTGTISLGQVVFLPGTQRITSINTVLGSTGGSGAGSGSGSGAGAGTGSSSGSGTGSGSNPGAGSTSGASATVSRRAEFVSLTTDQVASPATSTDASGGGRADAAAIMASWNAACAADDLASLESLKRQHPNVLASVEPSDCAPKPKPAPAPDPPQSTPTGPTNAQPALTSTTTVETSQKAPTLTTTTPTNSNPSGSGSPSGSGDPPGNGNPSGSGSPSGNRPSHGSGGKSAGNNASLQSALAALLKAEALELQRDSSGRGGGSSSGPGGASGGGRLTSSPASSAVGGAGFSGGAGSAGGGGSGSAGSSAGANAQPILGTTSNQLNVTVNLDATKQSEAVVGEPVTVQMPDGSVVDGKITQVSPVAQSSSSNGSSNGSGSGSGSSGGGSSSSAPTSTVPVTIALHGRLPASGLDQAAVSVNFEQQVERRVLSVPVTALLATAGGGYAVQVAGSSHRLIPVTPGLFAAGYVQVSSSQIYPGLQVTDSQG